MKYFIERYSPLIPIYRDRLGVPGSGKFNSLSALRRLQDVEAQFGKFRMGLDIPFPVA